MIFTGSAVAVITPFDENFDVDYKAYDKILDFHLENSTDALVVCGTTGEATTMTEDEKIRLIKYTVEKIDGRMPIIAGTGSNDTYSTAAFSKKVGKIEGVDGLLVVTPYYNKATKEGLYEHFAYIAKNSSKPIILYNVPSRTNVNIDLDTTLRLAQIENIVGIKDATGDLAYTAKLLAHKPKDFAVYSGNDDLTLPMLALGIDGSISVLANILPKENHEIYELFKAGQTDHATKLHLKYIDLIKDLFIEVNPVPVKAAAAMMGLCQNTLRLPLTPANTNTEVILKEKLKEFGLC
ncbi:4-hydroxy-tetrahydrodipicolinate synthase [Anaerococcus sp. NML200574]|uniref:4-hydroxy-tetrahydrodipicolinate synthase n=1 Tax=Anaerococcus kampingae TaxID=3115614 RepID=A0ABW9MAP1_9FIRM|nr:MULTISPECIES: 4-hydroxy-tetrahydrodipicolinate synthase [unclassified Anaerococcus]MCW6678923.1 4-hydroxy-tetrahydrodipicolinate synthase [Anaerococcus sp. NML200574]